MKQSFRGIRSGHGYRVSSDGHRFTAPYAGVPRGLRLFLMASALNSRLDSSRIHRRSVRYRSMDRKKPTKSKTGRAKIEPLLPPGYWMEWDADLLLLRRRDSGIVATFSARGVTQEAIEAVAWGEHGSEPTREDVALRAVPWPRHQPG